MLRAPSRKKRAGSGGTVQSRGRSSRPAENCSPEAPVGPTPTKARGYDKYVDYRTFSLAMALFAGFITSAASSMAYLLVIGTPLNAIVYVRGFLEPRNFLRIGIPSFILAFVFLTLLSMFYWPLLGFQGLAAY